MSIGRLQMSPDDRITKLARQIEDHARTDKRLLGADEVFRLRRQGAAQLHSICADFVASVNGKLSPAVLELSPPDYAPESFRNTGANLIQISGRGRIIQAAFQSTRERFSTEKYLIPYILEGEVRTYNQEMLDHFSIYSLGLFYCLGEEASVWRFSDWRRNHTGAFGHEFLVQLMEHLF